jgi:Periplasmic binding protein
MGGWMMSRWSSIGMSLIVVAALASAPALGQNHYDPGVTDTDIKLGQTVPYSGPVSAYGTFGRASVAYFAMINKKGGVNGRKITLLSVDDGFSPPKTVEQVRKLVESDQVFFLYAPVGSAPNLAIKQYLNDKRIPQLFVQSGLSSWNDPAHFPWSMSGLPSYPTDPATKSDPNTESYFTWMDQYYPSGDKFDGLNAAAYVYGQLVVDVLNRCGDLLTRANVMKQAASFHEFRAAMLRPGIAVNTRPDDYNMFKTLQMLAFDGKNLTPIGN